MDVTSFDHSVFINKVRNRNHITTKKACTNNNVCLKELQVDDFCENLINNIKPPFAVNTKYPTYLNSSFIRINLTTCINAINNLRIFLREHAVPNYIREIKNMKSDFLIGIALNILNYYNGEDYDFSSIVHASKDIPYFKEFLSENKVFLRNLLRIVGAVDNRARMIEEQEQTLIFSQKIQLFSTMLVNSKYKTISELNNSVNKTSNMQGNHFVLLCIEVERVGDNLSFKSTSVDSLPYKKYCSQIITDYVGKIKWFFNNFTSLKGLSLWKEHKFKTTSRQDNSYDCGYHVCINLCLYVGNKKTHLYNRTVLSKDKFLEIKKTIQKYL